MSREDDAEFHFWRASELYQERRRAEAFGHVEACLEALPFHLQALVLKGELLLFSPEAAGVSDDVAEEQALGCFDEALHIEPLHADAWSGKALVLLYMGRLVESLEAVNQGLSCISERVGYGMSADAVFKNVHEALLDVKFRVYQEMGRPEQATLVLEEALEIYPDSEFLRRHLTKRKASEE